MFSQLGRNAGAVLTLSAAVTSVAAIVSDDSLAGAAVFMVILFYIAAMAALFLCDFVVTSIRRSRAARSRRRSVSR